MIAPMARVRLMGPRDLLTGTLHVIQDAGVLHLTPSTPVASLHPVRLGPREARLLTRLKAMHQDLSTVLEASGVPPPISAPVGGSAASATELARWARTGQRLRRELEQLGATRRRLEDERAELVRFEQFGAAFQRLRSGVATTAVLHSYQLVLRAGDRHAAESLRQGLAAVLGEHFVLETATLDSGETAALLLVPPAEQARVERILVGAGIHELSIPASLGPTDPANVGAALASRRRAVDTELAELESRRAEIRREHGPDLRQAVMAVADQRLELVARQQAVESRLSFVLEGWVPVRLVGAIRDALQHSDLGETVVLEEVAREEWSAEDAPVVLQNPRLFRPFEVITAMMPLPRYGSIDPTPFVAVFFPMFFGLILGDVGYGLVLAGISALLHWRSRSGSTLRAVARVGGACAAFAIGFGLLFGEFLGDLGRRWFGMPHPLLDREESLLPFLALTVAIGTVHVTLGLVLGIVNAVRGHPRQALGRGLALLMLAGIGVVLLAATRVLPEAFFTPAVIVLLVLFPVLVVIEGIIAPIELLSTISNILSYARIMALGTASVMMAVVANQLVGALGGAVIGVVFGLLFHMVNFALGVFAPTIHGLRLHYVEFFGKFYSPGGMRYAPFTHWRPNHPTAT